MRNRWRDKLMRMCLYDMLLLLNSGIINGAGCIKKALLGGTGTCEKKDCDKCIAELLNKEVH